MDTADLIDGFMTGTYTVTRRSAAVYSGGRAVPGTQSTLQIQASVQPASGRDLLRLPEERRSVETRTVYTPTQLYVGYQGSPFESDLVSIGGVSWEVQHVELWVDPSGASPFYRCTVQAAT